MEDLLEKEPNELEMLIQEFQRRFKAGPPDVVVRAPGRLNLIGEHVDYEGYNVLPMAISQGVMVALRQTDAEDECHDEIHISNTDSDRFQDMIYTSSLAAQDIAGLPHTWAKYVLCALKGLYDYLNSNDDSQEPSWLNNGSGLRFLVQGNVPVSSGLSSSSALVCASLYSLVELLNINMSKRQMADLACICERYIGTEGGGMDQAVSLLANDGAALLVNFNPLQVEQVPLPKGTRVVVVDSLTPSCKAETAALRFNRRVLEMRTLREVEGLVGSTEAAAVLAESHLQDHLTLSQVEDALVFAPEGLVLGEAGLEAALRAQREVEKTNMDERNGQTRLMLRSRSKHVFSEAVRVREFASVCREAASSSSVEVDPEQHVGKSEKVFRRLGDLMDASHISCRDLYDCSCAQLDDLVQMCKKLGAIGARLTGAGWGGCVVALVRDEDHNTFMRELRRDFFTHRVADRGYDSMGGNEDQTLCFATKPSTGASRLF